MRVHGRAKMKKQPNTHQKTTQKRAVFFVTLREVDMKRAEVSGKEPEIVASSQKKPVRSGAKKPEKRTAGKQPARTVAFLDEKPAKTTADAGVRKKSAAKTGKTGRAKARKPNEKLTPASIYKKMIAFGKIYQIEGEQDFQEAARIYAEEAGLIDQMRDQIAEEGLTVIKSYKTGDVPVAHPLLSELPRHVESANKCLSTIGTMIGERGAKKERAARDLDKFRLH